MPWRARHVVLTVVSYLFYGWANPLFVVLLFFSTVVDYMCGLALVGRGPVWMARLLGSRALRARWSHPLPTLDPDTAETNPKVLRIVARGHDGMAGIYGAVLVEGAVKPDDEIKLL